MDALRSFAILIVLVGHIVLGYGSPAHLAPLQLGGMGVDLFFVLSGWLLGCQLFKEMDSGTIQVKRFWYRRWLRTLPAYYAVLGFTIFQQFLTKENPKLYWDYFVFLQNYNYPLEIFYVSWSLAVEEQFYLMIAPLAAGMLYLGKNQRLMLLVILLFTPSFFRELNWYSYYNETHVRFDGCVMGVMLALLRYQFAEFWQFLIKISGALFIISLIAFFLFFWQRWYPNDYIGEPGFLTRAFMFGCWVIFANKSDFIKTKLSFPGARYIATRSYSMYLLHPDAIAITNKLVKDANFYFYFSVVMALTFLVAELLYRLVEVPFIKFRDRVFT